MKRFFMIGVAALALAGCDQIAGLVGADEYNRNTGSGTNRSRGAADDGLISNLQPVGPPTGQDQQPGDQTGAPTDDQSEQQPGDQTGPTGGIDPSMLVGRWGDNGRCEQAIEFFANGTFRAANGGTGNWRLDGDRLTMFNGNRRLILRIRSITAQQVVAEDAQGQRGTSIRC